MKGNFTVRNLGAPKLVRNHRGNYDGFTFSKRLEVSEVVAATTIAVLTLDRARARLDEARLRSALEGGDIVPLLMVLIHFTEEVDLLDRSRSMPRTPAWSGHTRG